jgi:hypothetical protein
MSIDKSVYFPNSALEAEFEEFRKLKTKNEKEAFQKERKESFDRKTPEEQKIFREASENTIKKVFERVEELIEKVELGEVANIISVSYIAQKYFGKKRHWLYQRLNGSIVNGKPAQFTNDEKVKLKEALQDVSNIIQNTSFKIA